MIILSTIGPSFENDPQIIIYKICCSYLTLSRLLTPSCFFAYIRCSTSPFQIDVFSVKQQQNNTKYIHRETTHTHTKNKSSSIVSSSLLTFVCRHSLTFFSCCRCHHQHRHLLSYQKQNTACRRRSLRLARVSNFRLGTALLSLSISLPHMYTNLCCFCCIDAPCAFDIETKLHPIPSARA